MLTILPLLTVTRTWALPYWVSMAAPVAVPEEPVPLPLLPDEALELLDVDFAVVPVPEAVAAWTAGVCGWKARTPAVPATVAARTMGARCISWSPVRSSAPESASGVGTMSGEPEKTLRSPRHLPAGDRYSGDRDL